MTQTQARSAAEAGEARLPLPLAGVRVIDFSWHGAGPFTTRYLADHGADVIRVETRGRLDSLRKMPPFRPGAGGSAALEASGYFADRNSNKRDLLLNLKDLRARELALRLIAQADIVVNNFTPGTMDKLGLGYDAVRAFKPDVIYLSMSVNGSSGPDKDQVGYGLTMSALSGLHHLSGLPDREPIGTGTNYPDHVASPAHATFAVLAALRHRRRTGQGQQIDVSQAEAMISLLAPAVLDYVVNGRVETRRGNQVDGWAPHGVYPCAGEDRWLAIGVQTDHQWRALLDELDAADLAEDERFATLVARQRHHAALDAALATRTRTRDAEALMHRLQGRGVAAGAVRTAEDLVERDPALAARGHFARLNHPVMGPSLYNAPPFRLRGVAGPIMRSPAPLLGQHTAEVLRELLGLSDEAIEQLTHAGVLA